MSASIINAVKCIKEGSNQDLHHVLHAVHIESIDFAASVDLFGVLVQHAAQCDAPTDKVETIFHRWFPILEVDEVEQVIAIIAGAINIPISALKYVMKCFPDITPHEILDTNLQQPFNGCPFSLICDRIIEGSGKDISISTVKSLLHVALDADRSDAIGYLIHKESQMSPYTIQPSWVTVYPSEVDIPITIVDPLTWSKQVPAASSLVVEEFQNVVNDTLQTDTGEEIDERILKNVVEVAIKSSSMHHDSNADRIFGPTNCIADRQCNSSISGGCRMLSCRCRRDADDEDNVGDDDPCQWFTGTCDACIFRIRDLSHAIRFPVVGGGWIGCFCSIECMRAELPRDEDPMMEMRITCMINTIEACGIYDRSHFARRLEAPVPLPVVDEEDEE